MAKIKVGIVGGTGYTGVELLRLLSQHPHAELTAITSRKEDGMPVADMYSNLRGKVDLAFSSPDKARLPECDVVFFATPHGVAMAQAQELLAAGSRSSTWPPISGCRIWLRSRSGTRCRTPAPTCCANRSMAWSS